MKYMCLLRPHANSRYQAGAQALAAAEIELTLREGTYTLVAVCNYPASGSRAPSLKADVTLTELQNAVFYLGDNAKNALMMYGTATRIVPGEQELSVAIPVRRLVSRVAVNKITVAYANPALTGTTYLRGVYMTNLYRTNRLAEDWPLSSIVTTRSYWYNPAGWHRFEAYDDPTDALVGDRGLNTLLYNNSLPYTTEHVFYAFPNPSPAENDTHEEEWCTRSTRLVVWTEYEGTNYYYLVQLPAMKRNWRYTAQEIKITELGSPDEEYLPTTVDVVWEAEAEGWGDIVYINEES